MTEFFHVVLVSIQKCITTYIINTLQYFIVDNSRIHKQISK